MTVRACAYLACKDLEAALRRDRLMEVMDLEFQIAEEGDPREVAWLIEAYDALGVPIESRRATAVDLFARVRNAQKRASPWAAWQPFALEHEPIGSSTWPAVAGTPSTG